MRDLALGGWYLLLGRVLIFSGGEYEQRVYENRRSGL